MNIPKTFTLLLIGLAFYSQAAYAQDTSKNTSAQSKMFAGFEQEPVFPGGYQQFYKYIASNLKYPAVARLLGLTGKVYLTFVIDRDGTITDVKPIRCLGAGCESEAVRVVSMSPKWQPGIQKGRPVRVQYTIPIAFGFRTESGDLVVPEKTLMSNLRKSGYGFAFFINNKTYSLDDAQQILGKSFDPSAIVSVEVCSDPQYIIANKKETYLVVMTNDPVKISERYAAITTDTAKNTPQKVFTAVEIEPSFPGGINVFFQYINTNVHYPEAAKLLGINGKVIVDFWVDKRGRVVDVSALNSLGAGCEYEARKVVENSPPWRPGIQNGHPVKVQFKVPVSFDQVKNRIKMQDLKDSDYGFVFKIKDTLLTIDEAQQQLGKSFRQDKIESAEVFYNQDNDEKFAQPGKKEVYLVKIKS